MPDSITLSLGFDASSLSPTVLSAVNRVQSQIPEIKLRIDSRPLGTISRDLTQFDKSLEASNARVLAFGASVGIIGAVGAAFSSLVSSTIEVEARLADIQAVMGATAKSFSEFTQTLFDVAKNTGQAFSSVADAATLLSRQGLELPEILKRTSDAMILARISGISAAEAVSDLTTAINSFKREAIDSTEIINKIANVDASFAVTTADLAEAIKRTGSAAEDAKVSFDQLIGVVTAAQQITARGGAIIGNAFKTIFARVSRDSTLDALEELNIQVRDLQGNALPAITVLQNLANKFDSLSDSQKQATGQLLGGLYQLNILRATLGDLSSGFSAYQRAVETSAGATNEAIVRNNALNDTFQTLLNKTQTNLKQVFASIGSQTFEPVGKTLFGAFNSLFDQSKGSGADSKGIGQSIGQGLINGVSDFLKGPALIIVGALLYKLFSNAISSAEGAFKSVISFNTEAEKQKGIQDGINKILSSGNNIYLQRLQAAKSLAEQEQVVLDILRQENALQSRRESSNSTVASALANKVSFDNGGTKASFTGPAFAGGYVPSFVEEARAVRKGIGGASPDAKPVEVDGFNFGGGQKGSVVANTSEVIVKNYAGSDASAIFNPEMIQKVGGIANLNKLGKTQKIASSGYVPNFAEQILGEGSYGYFTDLGRKHKGIPIGRKDFYDTDKHEGLSGKENAEQEFAVSKTLESLNGKVHPLFQAPHIIGSIGGARRRSAIGKEVVAGKTGREFLSSLDGPEQFYRGSDLVSKLVSDFAYDEYFKAGVGLNDFNQSNYILNENAQNKLREMIKSKSQDEIAKLSGRQIADELSLAGGKLSVIDAGVSFVSPDAKTPARKYINKNFDGYGYAKGYVPNLVNDGVNDAVAREHEAGLPLSQIYVDNVRTNGYTGPVVANTRDEPNYSTLIKNVNSRYNVPNFATVLTDKEKQSITEQVKAAFEKTAAENRRKEALQTFQDPTQQISAPQLRLVEEELKKSFLKANGINFSPDVIAATNPDIHEGALEYARGQIEDRQFSYGLQQATVAEQKPHGFFGEVASNFGIESRIKKATGGNSVSPQNDKARQDQINQLKRDSADRLQNIGFQASFALPLISGEVQSFAGIDPNSQKGKAFSGVSSAISSGVSVASLIPGTPGLVAGGITAVFGSLKSVVDNVTKSFEALQADVKEQVNKKNEESVAVTNVAQAYSNLKQVIENNGSPEAIRGATISLNNQISGVSSNPAVQRELQQRIAANDERGVFSIANRENEQSDNLKTLGNFEGTINNINNKNPLYEGPGRYLSFFQSRNNLVQSQNKTGFGALLGRGISSLSSYFSPGKKDLSEDFEKSLQGLTLSFNKQQIDRIRSVQTDRGQSAAVGEVLSQAGEHSSKARQAFNDAIDTNAGGDKAKADQYRKEFLDSILKNTEANNKQVQQVVDNTFKFKQAGELYDQFLTQTAANLQFTTQGTQGRRELVLSGAKGAVDNDRPSLDKRYQNSINFALGQDEIRNTRLTSIEGVRSDLLADFPKALPDIGKGANVQRKFVSNVADVVNSPDLLGGLQNTLDFVDQAKQGLTLNGEPAKDGSGQKVSAKTTTDAYDKVRDKITEAINKLRDIDQKAAQQNVTLEQQKVLAQRAIEAEENAKVLGGDFRKIKGFDTNSIQEGYSAGNLLSRGAGTSNLLNQGEFDNFFYPRKDVNANNAETRELQRTQAIGGLDLLSTGLIKSGKNQDVVRGQVRDATAGQINNVIDQLLQGDLPPTIREELTNRRGDVNGIADEQARRLVPLNSQSGEKINTEIQGYLEKARVSTEETTNIQIIASEARKIAENTLNTNNTLLAILGKTPQTQDQGTTTANATPAPTNKANGYIPDTFQKEQQAIQRGVGGAMPWDRPVTTNVNGLGNVTVNTGERVVQNFLGSGKGAVLTRQMQQTLSRGYIPNFAEEAEEAQKVLAEHHGEGGKEHEGGEHKSEAEELEEKLKEEEEKAEAFEKLRQKGEGLGLSSETAFPALKQGWGKVIREFVKDKRVVAFRKARGFKKTVDKISKRTIPQAPTPPSAVPRVLPKPPINLNPPPEGSLRAPKELIETIEGVHAENAAKAAALTAVAEDAGEAGKASSNLAHAAHIAHSAQEAEEEVKNIAEIVGGNKVTDVLKVAKSPLKAIASLSKGASVNPLKWIPNQIHEFKEVYEDISEGVKDVVAPEASTVGGLLRIGRGAVGGIGTALNIIGLGLAVKDFHEAAQGKDELKTADAGGRLLSTGIQTFATPGPIKAAIAAGSAIGSQLQTSVGRGFYHAASYLGADTSDILGNLEDPNKGFFENIFHKNSFSLNVVNDAFGAGGTAIAASNIASKAKIKGAGFFDQINPFKVFAPSVKVNRDEYEEALEKVHQKKIARGVKVKTLEELDAEHKVRETNVAHGEKPNAGTPNALADFNVHIGEPNIFPEAPAPKKPDLGPAQKFSDDLIGRIGTLYDNDKGDKSSDQLIRGQLARIKKDLDAHKEEVSGAADIYRKTYETARAQINDNEVARSKGFRNSTEYNNFRKNSDAGDQPNPHVGPFGGESSYGVDLGVDGRPVVKDIRDVTGLLPNQIGIDGNSGKPIVDASKNVTVDGNGIPSALVSGDQAILRQDDIAKDDKGRSAIGVGRDGKPIFEGDDEKASSGTVTTQTGGNDASIAVKGSNLAGGYIPNFAYYDPYGRGYDINDPYGSNISAGEKQRIANNLEIQKEQKRQSDAAERLGQSNGLAAPSRYGAFNPSAFTGYFGNGSGPLGSNGGLSRGAYNKTHIFRHSRAQARFDSVQAPNEHLQNLILSGIIGEQVNGESLKGAISTAKLQAGFYAEGYVPNDLHESVEREQEALAQRGYYAGGLVQVGYSPRIGGLGVYNKIDEPFGLDQGIDRVARQGGNPMKSGTPNFADSLDSLSKSLQGLLGDATQTKGTVDSIDVNHNHSIQLSLSGEIQSSHDGIKAAADDEVGKMKSALEARIRELELSHSKTNSDYVLRP